MDAAVVVSVVVVVHRVVGARTGEGPGQHGRGAVAPDRVGGAEPVGSAAVGDARGGQRVYGGLVDAAVVIAEAVLCVGGGQVGEGPGQQGGELAPGHLLSRAKKARPAPPGDARGRESLNGGLIDAAVIIKKPKTRLRFLRYADVKKDS